MSCCEPKRVRSGFLKLYGYIDDHNTRLNSLAQLWHAEKTSWFSLWEFGFDFNIFALGNIFHVLKAESHFLLCFCPPLPVLCRFLFVIILFFVWAVDGFDKTNRRKSALHVFSVSAAKLFADLMAAHGDAGLFADVYIISFVIPRELLFFFWCFSQSCMCLSGFA